MIEERPPRNGQELLLAYAPSEIALAILPVAGDLDNAIRFATCVRELFRCDEATATRVEQARDTSTALVS